MLELRPCPACARHVGVDEVACPFCAVALVRSRPRSLVLGGRMTRAAVFGAALAAGACGKSDEPVKPVPVHEDPKDLENVLDQPFAGSARVPSDAAPDATAIAQSIDAGVAPDAAVDSDAIARREAERKRKAAERRRDAELERQRQQREQDERVQELQRQQQQQQFHNAKPYGAPPARRRIV